MNAVNFPVWRDAASLQSEAREKALGLRELRYFLSVAQTGNFGRAALDLNVSQPAVSLQMRKLEEGLGAQLLLRHGRGVTLTPAGACLRDRLQTVMRLLASPLDEAVAEPTPDTISFGVPADLGAPLVAPLASAFRARWPDMRLDVREGSGGDLEEWLLRRHVDLAILHDPAPLPEFEVRPVLSESLGLVAPVHSQLAAGSRPLPLRELANEPLILPARQHWLRRSLDQAARQSGVRLNPVLQVDGVTLTKRMVRGGLGYAILPRSAVLDDVANGGLAFRPVGQPPLTCTRVVAFHRVASNSLVTVFAEMASAAMVGLAEDAAWPQAQPSEPVSPPIQAHAA